MTARGERSWTATVAGPYGQQVRYDCRAEDQDQARTVIAGLARREPGDVHDVARVCGIFSSPEAGDPR
jgi:hypothetical protein